ncbi:uncharacterized protein [Diabrotica undecimpunctata]|uniref:uncharacterized protein n=1 Tax=Diabrotica undecimpunctata TaxID=50387 RepID=UPI003B641441
MKFQANILQIFLLVLGFQIFDTSSSSKITPKHLHKILDSSCKGISPPHIKNAELVKLKTEKLHNGRHKQTEYLVAEYRCTDGYGFKDGVSNHLFCSKKRWIGKTNLCKKKIKENMKRAVVGNIDPGFPIYFGECSIEDKKKCSHLCYLLNGEATCGCPQGFRKKGNICEDINECDIQNGGCQHFCVNNIGSFSCDCPKGYQISYDGISCEDINECHVRNGHGPCQDTCHNLPGSYRCSCSNLTGTRLADDLHTCADINQCTGNLSGCSHGCINSHGRAYCTCPQGMELGDDWKTCKDINECEDPSIKSTCPHGCTNFIGSYYCPKHDEILLSDAPVSDDDEYDSEDYETDQYDDDEYDEEEYDDDKDEQEKESSTKSINNKDRVQENPKKIDKKIDTIYDDDYDEGNDDDYKENTTNNTKKINESDKNKIDIDNAIDKQDIFDKHKETETVKTSTMIKEKEKPVITNKNDIYTDYEDEYDDEYDDDEETTIATDIKVTNTSNKDKTNDFKTSIISSEVNKNENTSNNVEKPTTETYSTSTRKIAIEYEDEYDEDYDDITTTIRIDSTSKIPAIQSIKENGIQNRNDVGIKESEKHNLSIISTNTIKEINEVTDKSVSFITTEKEIDEEYDDDSNDYDEYNEETTILNIDKKVKTNDKEYDSSISKPSTDMENEYTTTQKQEISTVTNRSPKRIEPDDSVISTTLKIITASSTNASVSTEHPSVNIINKDHQLQHENDNKINLDISNNLSPLGTNIANKNTILTSDNYEDSYDEEDEDYDENTTTVHNRPYSSTEPQITTVRTENTSKNINKIVKLEDTTRNNKFNEVTDISNEDIDRNDKGDVIFITTTRKLSELDKIDITTTERVSDKTNIDRINNSNKTKQDDEYDDYDEFDSKKEGSTIVNSMVNKCEEGYSLNERGECTDIDECSPSTNPCSDICENTAGSYICSCAVGFKLNSADPHTCQDIDECQQSPCSHICKNTPGSYSCECPKTLTLQNSTCVNLTCSHGETRINGKVQCTCPLGFVLGSDNRTCEDVDECVLLQDCSQICTNVIGSYECSCEKGYTLEREKYCIDIDECKGNHGCHQVCENIPGSFKCSCEDGFEFMNGTLTCVDVDECAEGKDLDECSQICINYLGGYECSCHTGYKLSSDDASCQDIDECTNDNGNCTHICENIEGSYFCKCEENYMLESDNRTCKIVDPCLEDNGGCSHECVNKNGVAVCKCPKGHTLEDRDCYLLDPCLTNNGGCSHICVNANSVVRCECPKEYELVNSTTCMKINLCSINNGNCSHFCEFIDDKVNCMCPELYSLENGTQCIEINPCLENNGGCSHTCIFKNHKQSCSCPHTHELHNTTHCFEKNPCLEDNGGCSDTCIFENSVLSCSCPRNYYLEGKTCYRIDRCLKENGGCSHICLTDDDGDVSCMCPEGFLLGEDFSTCLPQDPCLINNGNCSHICNSTQKETICSCPEGYRLKNETHCEKYNPCLLNNGGCSDICENIFGKARCSCPDNYVLEDDYTCIIIDPCFEENGGCSHYCKNIDGKPKCSCPDRHNLVNKTTCVQVNPCFINNGGCSHECATDENNNVICLCPQGQELAGKTCMLINPCNHKNGGCSHICSSIEGAVICKCPPGHELIDKTCFKVNPCSINNGGCSHGCSNSRGQAKCTCPPGYKLFGKTCMDQNPCTKNNGGCSHICHNKEGKRECSCPPGYLLRPNKRVCKEINECRVNRGGCSHGCRNLPGSFQCTCPHGLQLEDVKNRTCIDVDECLVNNGDCEMICRNFKGGFKCDCPEGYSLQRDKRSCRMAKVAHCRVPPAPSNGVIRCWDKSEMGSFVPSGAKCNVWCNEGYKLMGDSQMICGDSGSWGENEPQCLVATCPKLPSIQNGWYLPGVCNSGRTYIGESCSVYCRQGFMLKAGIEKYVCDPNMNWMPTVRPDALYNACTKTPSNTYINCPQKGQIDFILPEGQRQMFVKIPRPEANVDWSFVTSQPTWGIRLETTLPAGRTEVRFMAASPTDFNSTASCRLVINVLDKEAPRMTGCPENIERRLATGEGTQIIHWREPHFFDNVGVATVYKTRESGSEFGSGLHHITYVASDEAGNRAFCHFSIDVRDDLDNVQSNSIEQLTSATYTSHRTAGKYKAVLICPSGVQFMSDNPDRYNNMITSEAGCYWRHVKVTKPLEPQSFQIPKVYSESRLPPHARSNRRVFFKWSR